MLLCIQTGLRPAFQMKKHGQVYFAPDSMLTKRLAPNIFVSEMFICTFKSVQLYVRCLQSLSNCLIKAAVVALCRKVQWAQHQCFCTSFGHGRDQQILERLTPQASLESSMAAMQQCTAWCPGVEWNVIIQLLGRILIPAARGV